MKRIARTLIRLYPASWRARYGEEFEGLLEDNPATLSSLFDLMRGAIGMQLNVPAFPKIAVFLSLVGLLTGLGVSFAVNPRYVSTATFAYNAVSPRDFNRNLYEYFMQQQAQIVSRTSLSSVIQNPQLDLYRSARTRLPLEDVIEKMRADTDIRVAHDDSASRGSLAFRVSFTYPDAAKARDTVARLIQKFQEANMALQRSNPNPDRAGGYDEIGRLEQRLAALERRAGISAPTPNTQDLRKISSDGVNLDVIDPPSLPVDPISPNRSAFMLAGFGAGLVLALLIAIFRRRSPPIPFPAQTI